MSDISPLAFRVGGEGELGNHSPYHYATWLRERGRGGVCVPSPWEFVTNLKNFIVNGRWIYCIAGLGIVNKLLNLN
jgi:hypothetical protein